MSAKAATPPSKALTLEVEVCNKLGIHARPAAVIARIASSYKQTEVFIEKAGEKVNGKSIMGLLMLAAGPGTRLTLHAEGKDGSQALAELERFFKRKFDEE